MNFEFTLIDNKVAHQFKYIRYLKEEAFLGILFFVLFVVLQKIEYVITILFFLAIIYAYTQRVKVIGRLSVNDNQIKIVQEVKEFIFDFTKITNLVIERGATWHLQYQNSSNEYDRTELMEFDNWVKFEYEGKSYNFEFLIGSIQSNEHFEAMIIHFHRLNIQHKYLSI